MTPRSGPDAMRGVFAIGLASIAAACTTLPVVPPGELDVVAARYACDDGTRFTARFDRAGEGAELTFENRDRDDRYALPQDRGFRVVLASQRPGSGLWYAGGGWSLRGKGDEATLNRPDGRAAACRAGAERAGDAQI